MVGRERAGGGVSAQKRPVMTEGRRKRLAKVHLARKALALEEESYRALLHRITGYTSAAACGEAELDAVLQEFRRLGFADKKILAPMSDKLYVRMIYGIWRDLKPYVRDHSRGALRRFVQRQTKTAERPEGVGAPEFLNPEDGNLVIEGLKAWLRRERDQAKACEGAGE